jgi:acyl-CoA thioesterase
MQAQEASPIPAQATPQQVAEACRDAMWQGDQATRALGITVLAVGPGSARLAMTVKPDMLNGHAICHGGLIATLADSAFAFACNAYNELTVAAGFDINLLAAARLGDVLTATASEISRARRTGVYDVSVVNQHGHAIAAFRGRSHTRKGHALVAGLPVGKQPAAAR